MDNSKEEFQKYLPDVEKFLTSVLLEETHIGVVSSESIERESTFEDMQKTDIFLYTRDREYNSDLIIVLEKEWYGLLSSIMLGVEEKTNNETTRNLLKKFASQLIAALKEQMEKQGMTPDPEEVQVLTLAQTEEKLAHSEYFLTKLEIEGLADDKVRAEFLLGNNEALLTEQKEPTASPSAYEREETSPENKDDNKSADIDTNDKDFSPVDAAEMEEMGSVEEVISAKHIEFDDFDDNTNGFGNGDSRGMDLLKDVEMDVSVELGRIELSLGKVLQLAKGSVIELEKLAGEPVDILVNGHCIAHGEVVVIDEHFGVRISNLITTRQRIAKLK